MINLRKIRVGIQIDGKTKFFTDLKIKASGKKFTDPTQNEATIVISGLSEKTRNFLQQETSVFTKKKTASKISIETGRENTEYFLVFIGDIIGCELSIPPDLDLTIKAKTNNANSCKVVITNGKAISKLSEIAKIVANNNNLSLKFLAKDKNIANYSYCGNASKQIKDLQETGGVNAFVEDKELIIKDDKTPVSNRRRILNMNSGLIGIPRFTDDGVEITYLIDGESLLGGQIALQSKFNKPLNGDYIIETLSFDIENQGDNFFYTAVCRRI